MANFDFYKDAKFISDQPAETDEFSGQAHARVANTLVNIVATGEGGRAVGLEGTWGSGKSTVIDFALAQFEKWNEDKSPKQRVFVFDAWPIGCNLRSRACRRGGAGSYSGDRRCAGRIRSRKINAEQDRRTKKELDSQRPLDFIPTG